MVQQCSTLLETKKIWVHSPSFFSPSHVWDDILSQGLCSKNGLGNVETGLTLVTFRRFLVQKMRFWTRTIFLGSLFSVETICYFLKKWF
jgi:hypothetical protein